MDNENINHRHKKRNNILAKAGFDGLYIVGAVFCLTMAALVLLQMNIQYKIRPDRLSLMSKEELSNIKRLHNDSKEPFIVSSGSNLPNENIIINNDRCLLVLEEGEPQSEQARDLWIPILEQMKMPYDICDAVDYSSSLLFHYRKVIIAITNYPKLSEELSQISSWVENGGNLMIAYPPSFSGSYQSLFYMLGVKDCGDSNVIVESLHFNKDFMIGGMANDFPIIDAYDCSLSYSLEDDCTVYMQSTDAYPTPLIWRRAYGKGSVVVDNFGIIDKAYRGIHCAAFSLLGNYCVYPVINGAVFYLDDFPSPVPEGNSTYINRDYHISVNDFYMQIWWNDLYRLAKKYGIDFTGLIIEDYSNTVSGDFPRNYETTQFLYFGNMLLDEGGEIGIHGYNHMPLVLENFDYQNQYDSYIHWPTKEDVLKALNEVFSFTHELFPEEELSVYVPPSNILSDEGRELLNKETPIRCIASVYLPGDLCYEQEFNISDDGIINTPRITSGCIINDYMKITALSELNFHLVNSHFHHPDDVLDEDRGAELGWAKLYSNLQSYYEWLYTSCPSIRNMTGTEFAGAVERYDLLEVNREFKDTDIGLNLNGFHDEAWFLLRINTEENIEMVTNGNYTKVADDLYLVECSGNKVDIKLTT